MCGIIGVISNFSNGLSSDEEKIFKQLLYVDALRGEDATGVFVVGRDSEVRMAKEANDSHMFSWQKDYTAIMGYAFKEGRVAVGHNRAKTFGANTDDNAHPFVVNDEFILVHNGTLTNKAELETSQTLVDSEALAQHFHKAGTDNGDGMYHKETMDLAIGAVRGAYACVWFDQRNERLYLMRNSQRPLYLAELKNGTMVFASEQAMIYLCANRNGQSVHSCDMIDEETLYAFDFSKQSASRVDKVKLDKKVVFKQAPTNQTSGTQNHLGGGTHGGTSIEPPDLTLQGEISKQQFKTFRNKYAGTTVPFIVEDYVERIPQPGDLEEDKKIDWIVFGRLEQNVLEKESYYAHVITAKLQDKSMKEIIDLYDGTLLGTVESMEYDRSTKSVNVFMKNVRLPYDATAACH